MKRVAIEFKRDRNGNKVAKFSGEFLGLEHGVTIQTNGNLPHTHRMTIDNLNATDLEIIKREALAYLADLRNAKQ